LTRTHSRPVVAGARNGGMDRRDGKPGLQPVSRILEGVLRECGLQERLEERAALAGWSEIVGADVAGHARAVDLVDGVLTLEADHGAWRQEVTMLIRTMPDPAGPAPIRAPREAMLRELGLKEESPVRAQAGHQTPQAPIPIEGISSKPKVGRNAPCPCGSGRKYKKCCGRTGVS